MSTTTVAGALVGLALLGTSLPAGAQASATARAQNAADQQAAPRVEIASSAITLSSRPGGRAELTIELESGAEHRISFEDGAIRIDGERVGAYAEDGRLVDAWRSFLREQLGRPDAGLGGRLLAWSAGPLPEAEGEVAAELYDGIARALGVPPEPAESAPAADLAGGQVSIAPGGVGFSDLARELERLQAALGALGESTRDVGSRLALIVHDDYAVPAGRTVTGNLALLDGTLRLGGTVSGDVLVLDGELVLGEGARVEGDILQVGGDVELDGGAVTGEILADLAVEEAEPSAGAAVETPAAPPAPRAPRAPRGRDRGPFDRLSHNLGHAVEGVLGTLSAFLAFAVIGLLFVYFARGRLEIVADTVRHEFARSFAMGLAGEVLFFPALLVLCVLVITIPVIPFFILGTGLALLAGYIAVAHGAGEMFAHRRYRYEWLERLRRSNSYYYVLSGLALLLLPFAIGSAIWVFGGLLDFLRGIVFFVAALGTWVLVTAGFGGVLLTRGGSRSIVVDWTAEEVDLSRSGPAPGAGREPAGESTPGASADAARRTEPEPEGGEGERPGAESDDA